MEMTHNWEHDRGFGQEHSVPTLDGRMVGTGVERNQAHDKGLEREIRVWKEEIAIFGGKVIKEWNSNDLLRLWGAKVNGPMTREEKESAAAELGFELKKNGKPDIPDHILLIRWKDGRLERIPLEHLHETYRPGICREKTSHSSWRISGSNERGFRGRRVKDGPDVLEGLVNTRLKTAR
jgi:hypothetical protein